MDTEQLAIINTIKVFFVVREKRRMSYTVIEDKQYNNPITGVMADQTIQFSGYKTRKQYSSPMRRITFYDKEGNRTFVFTPITPSSLQRILHWLTNIVGG